MTKAYHHGDLRTAMLQAAEAILDQDGIGALSLRAAARKAEVTHTAPRHHFGDITGLLTELAASGFVRLRSRLLAEADAAGPHPRSRLIAFGRGYVGFARAHPGLLQLMLRSERLDWSSPTLSTAATAAFELLTEGEPEPEDQVDRPDTQRLVLALTRLSLVHGLTALILDGRVEAMAAKVPGVEIEALVEGVLMNLVEKNAGGSSSSSGPADS
jgi:AcrR family transcriptional regulator